MLTFNLKTTFFTVKTSNEVYCCRIYFVNYIQNVHIINRTLHGSLEDMDFMFSWQEQYLTREMLFLPLEHKIHIFSQPCNILYLLYGLSKFSILIGSQAVRKNPYPDRGPYFPYLDRCPGCRLSGGKF